MRRNIDNLVERETGTAETPGDRLEEAFLDDRPKSQWPPYLDETAKQVADDIAIGETELVASEFPEEVGPLYESGLLAATGNHSDLPATMEEMGTTDLGRAIYLLNRLSVEIQQSDTGLSDIQRAITAVLEKILSDTVEMTGDVSLDGQTNSTADVLLQLLSDPTVADQVDTVLEEFEATYKRGLLSKLDEPQMMTPLWNHQREALSAWYANDKRGYVDMATATGKTVLGLAAIATEFGSLHDRDAEIDTPPGTTGGKADVLVVAHNDLILEQWRREFDRHLSIPPDRTHGSDDVDLTWGRIHFRTAQDLLNQELIAYDLVILDEAHHYANGAGWGQLLERFDADVLALSGSVDAGSDDKSSLQDRLQERIGPELIRYTIADAQDDGVIPTFDWTVSYTPAGVDSEFVEITEKSSTRYDEFRDRLEVGAFDIPPDVRLRTFEDITAFSHTTEGTQLKEEDDQFQDLVTTLFSRRTQRWNQSPKVETVADIAAEYPDRKVVILTNNNAQIDALLDQLENTVGIDPGRLFTVRSRESSKTQRDTVDRFDIPGEPGILIGTGDLLGEGVDTRHAEVGINMATGSVNKELIQRIGRVLRNPTGDKEAKFVNVVGVPARKGGQIPHEDGQTLIEDAVQFHGFGESFGNQPLFETAGDAGDAVGQLLRGGRDRIQLLQDNSEYSPDDVQSIETTGAFLSAVDTHLETGGVEMVLQAWGSTAETTGESDAEQQHVKEESQLTLKVVNSQGTPVEEAFVSLVGDGITRYSRTDRDGRVSFTVEATECTAAIHSSDTGASTVDVQFEETTVEQAVTIGSEVGS